MKFYEKIIGIDKASPHYERTITFDSGVFKFSTGALSLDGSHGPAINFRNSGVTISDLDDSTLHFGAAGTELVFNFYQRCITSSSTNPINLGTAYNPFTGYFQSIQPKGSGSSADGTLGTSSTRGPEIGAKDINSAGTATLATADITTANITTANITNSLSLARGTTIKDSTGAAHHVGGLSVYSDEESPYAPYAYILYGQASLGQKSIRMQFGTGSIDASTGKQTIEFRIPFFTTPQIVVTPFTYGSAEYTTDISIVSSSSTGFVVKGDSSRPAQFNGIAIGGGEYI